MKFNLKDYQAKEALRMIREWTGLNQTDFAKSLNRNRYTIQAWELGRSVPTLKTIYEIAKKYDLDITIEKKR